MARAINVIGRLKRDKNNVFFHTCIYCVYLGFVEACLIKRVHGNIIIFS